MSARILIVEDDYHLALLLQYNLEAAGFEVEHVDSGDDAERRIAEHIPDLVLLDWMLPGISGIELCRRMRSQASTRALPIMILTARTEADDRGFAITMGADAFMSKPFMISEVLARARRLLASPAVETLATTAVGGRDHQDRRRHDRLTIVRAMGGLCHPPSSLCNWGAPPMQTKPDHNVCSS